MIAGVLTFPVLSFFALIAYAAYLTQDPHEDGREMVCERKKQLNHPPIAMPFQA
jgi:hypothetical protein